MPIRFDDIGNRLKAFRPGSGLAANGAGPLGQRAQRPRRRTFHAGDDGEAERLNFILPRESGGGGPRVARWRGRGPRRTNGRWLLGEVEWRNTLRYSVLRAALRPLSHSSLFT
jgi:hypothetical protein